MSESESFEDREKRKQKKREELMKKQKGAYQPSEYEGRRFSSGIYQLDKATNLLPHGRIIEAYGAESSGKTTLAKIISAEINKINYETGKVDMSYSNPCSVFFGDLEHTFSKPWSEKLGFYSEKYGNSVDYILGGDTCCDVVTDLIKDDLYSLIVVDSTERMSPQKVLEGEYEMNDMGLKARAISRSCKKWAAAISDAYIRHKGTPWRVPTILLLSPAAPIFMDLHNRSESTAGNVMRLYCTIRLFLSKLKVQTEGSPHFGKGAMQATVKKHKLESPGYIAQYMIALQDIKNLKMGQIDNVSAILTDAKDLDMIQKVKTNYLFMGETYDKMGDLKTKLYEDLEFQSEVWKEVISRIGKQGIEFDPNEIEE